MFIPFFNWGSPNESGRRVDCCFMCCDANEHGALRMERANGVRVMLMLTDHICYMYEVYFILYVKYSCKGIVLYCQCLGFSRSSIWPRAGTEHTQCSECSMCDDDDAIPHGRASMNFLRNCKTLRKAFGLQNSTQRHFWNRFSLHAPELKLFHSAAVTSVPSAVNTSIV